MAFLGGQFKSATHGQFKSAQGGQFDRLLQLFERFGRMADYFPKGKIQSKKELWNSS